MIKITSIESILECKATASLLDDSLLDLLKPDLPISGLMEKDNPDEIKDQPDPSY